MAANISTTMSNWSSTASSNQPDSTDLASTLREDLQAIQAAVATVFPGMAGRAWREQTKASDYPLAATDNMSVIVVTAAATISGTAATLGNGFLCIIYNTHSSAITLPGTYSLPVNAAVILVSNGSGWRHYAFAVGNVPSVTSLTATGAVTGGSLVTGTATISDSGTVISSLMDSGDSFEYNKSSNYFRMIIGSAGKFVANTSAIYPDSSGGMTCGSSSNLWSAVYATNGTIQTSDKRRKDHVEDITDTGEIIDAMRPVRFRWKQTGKIDAGFYAQDEAENVPEAVEPGTDEIDWGWKPDRVIPYLVAEIKALRRRVAELESK